MVYLLLEQWECRQRLQTYRISHCSCTAISRALGTEQTHKQNKHPQPPATPCLQSTRQRRELQSNFVHHHSTTSNTTGLLVHHLILGHCLMTLSFPCPQVFVIQWSITTLWADHLGSPGRSLLRRWKVCLCRRSLIQQGQMRSDFSGTDCSKL